MTILFVAVRRSLLAQSEQSRRCNNLVAIGQERTLIGNSSNVPGFSVGEFRGAFGIVVSAGRDQPDVSVARLITIKRAVCSRSMRLAI